MNKTVFDQLHTEGLISEASLKKIYRSGGGELFSLHWELKTLLYLGVMLLSTGLGIVVYRNIDTIGHQVILFFIGTLSAASFGYCFKKKFPFSTGKVRSPNAFFDYILILACLMFITFIAYFQYQYNIFGNRYGLATFIPMILLFFTAYYFDHLGILSMGITNLAAWLGITVTPSRILDSNDFNSSTLILTAVLLGILLVVAGHTSVRQNFKKHFEFTYTNFGMHILFIGLVAALFQFERIYFVPFILLVCTAYYFYLKSVKENSFYFLLIATLYAYVGVSYVVVHILGYIGGFNIAAAYLAMIYFIASGIALIMFLMRTNKKLRHDSI